MKTIRSIILRKRPDCSEVSPQLHTPKRNLWNIVFRLLCFFIPISIIIFFFILGMPWWSLIPVSILTCPLVHLLIWLDAKAKYEHSYQENAVAERNIHKDKKKGIELNIVLPCGLRLIFEHQIAGGTSKLFLLFHPMFLRR